MKPTIWENCYESGWVGFLSPASMAHPAKYSKALIERIFDHMLARSYIHKNDLCADPFGGVGTGGVVAAYRGLRWIGVELEPRFVGFARDNFKLHRSKLEYLGCPLPKIVQGDSRRFHEIVGEIAATITSPPYADSIDRPSGIDPEKVKKPGGPNCNTHQDNYGRTNGQIGRLKEGQVDSVITSPPFATQQTGGGIVHQADRKTVGRQNCGYQNQGKTNGQIADLREGTVDAIVKSELHAITVSTIIGDDSKQTASEENVSIGDVSQGHFQKGKLLPSVGSQIHAALEHCAKTTSDCDVVELKKGSIGLSVRETKNELRSNRGVVRKAPSVHLEGHAPTEHPDEEQGPEGSGTSSLQKRSLESGLSKDCGEKRVLEMRGENESRNPSQERRSLRQPDRKLGDSVQLMPHEDSQKGVLGGKTIGQADSEKQRNRGVAALVTSPPWEKNCEGGVKSSRIKNSPTEGSGHYASPAARKAQMERDEQKVYGGSKGQIGQESGPTYWSEMFKVYSSCYFAIKPGGYMAVVVKSYVKHKQIVDLPSDTGRLLEHIGFEPVERIHAMLVKETRHDDLFSGETKTTKSRKSFFRRLAENRGSPKIDFEVVLIYRKPCSSTLTTAKL